MNNNARIIGGVIGAGIGLNIGFSAIKQHGGKGWELVIGTFVIVALGGLVGYVGGSVLSSSASKSQT